MRYHTLLLILASLSGLSNLQSQPASTDLYLQTSEVNNLMVHYNADHNGIIRFYGTAGEEWWQRSRGNDPNTPERRQRLLKLIDDYLRQLNDLPFDGMNINGKVDYLLFRRNLLDEQYQLRQEEKNFTRVAGFFPFSERLLNLITPRRRGAAVQGEAVARELEAIRKTIARCLDSLRKSDSLEKKSAELASATAEGLRGQLRDYYQFYNGYDPLFSWWVPRTYTETDSLLRLFAGQLKSRGRVVSSQQDDGSGIIGNPIGREELIRQLRLEFIPYGPEELVDIANREFAWCDSQMRRAARDMGFGDNWKAALEKVKNSYVEPGQQPRAMYEIYQQSVDFLKKKDLLTIPPFAEEEWGMYMMSPERQRVNPFFLGGESLIISYPTSSMSFDEKMMSMRGNNPYFSRATIHHELIAGHHLQGFMTDRYKAYRHFDTPFWVEGNSLYWELLLWDLGFPRSPEERVGMLFWRMHRCARIIFSLSYHLGNWTPQQCINFLVDRVGHERANAEGEVRRSFTGGYGPLYQIAYMIGGLQFMALKRELVDSHRMTYRQYHDAILRENSMPIEMLRILLLGLPVKKDYETSWRFYGK